MKRLNARQIGWLLFILILAASSYSIYRGIMTINEWFIAIGFILLTLAIYVLHKVYSDL